MILPDVNVLVLAHRADMADHEAMRTWLEEEVNSGRPFALADVAVAGFLRVVTSLRVFNVPSDLGAATGFLDGLMAQPGCLPVSAGPRYWEVLRQVLRDADARGNLVPDAHLAAIAFEHGATIATRDRGFARFRMVRWVDPLDERPPA